MTPPVQEPHLGLNAAVAAEIRAEQGRRKLSVQALAQVTGIPYGSLRRYLNAERHIDVAVLAEICQALDMDPADLVQRAAVALGSGSDDELAKRRPTVPTIQQQAARDEED